MKKIFFKNLNTIRFIAASAVVIHHIEQLKSILGLRNNWDNHIIREIGKLGVLLFFVLSGFLITYLLLEEKKQFKTIHVKAFYIRRFLRIWPLYYLIVIISLLILNQISLFQLPQMSQSFYDENLFTKVILFILILPNVVLSYFGALPYASQTWSIGVEEQFYLLWPWVIKKSRYPLRALIAVLVIYLSIKVILNYLSGFYPEVKFYGITRGFWFGFTISSMAIGGLFAYVLFSGSYLLKLIVNKSVLFVSIFVTLFMIYFNYQFAYVIKNEVYSILFAIIILNLASETINIENIITTYLGKISYGLYMYHAIAIVISIRLGQYYNLSNIFIYLLSFMLSIIMAALSYKYFEKYFISKKHKFTFIKSGT